MRIHRRGDDDDDDDDDDDAIDSVVDHDRDRGATTPSGGGEGGGGGGRGGMLTKFARALLSPSSGGTKRHPDGARAGRRRRREGEDPHIRGPAPILTARLVNRAPLTSTALTYRIYGGGDGDGGCDAPGAEELNLAVHLHEDGVARLRITEVLEEDVGGDGGGRRTGDGGSGRRSIPRWTSDELVLNEEGMTSTNAEDVQVMSVNPDIRERLSYLGTDMLASNESSGVAILSLIGRANLKDQSSGNFIVLSHGRSDGGGGEQLWHLMMQLEPFVVYFFRGNNSNDNDGDEPPMIIAGTGGLTHFEIRRGKKCSGRDDAGSVNKRKLSDFDVDLGDDETEDNDDGNDEEDRHGGKEVVGYWEDGLAIYADGSREERRELAPASAAVDDTTDAAVDAEIGDTREQRRLDEGQSFDTKDMWEEKFGDHTDSKPHGPMSVGMELTFPASAHLFGLPEHASSTQLKTTAGGDSYYSEPYRLYNLDVFEYELDETMALYGHIPLVISQSMRTGTAGAFWFNPTETFVDVEAEAGSSRTHFMSESGIIDLFLLPGPDPASMYEQYARITGRMSLPPIFALGYHQCRWNYRDEADVYHVHSKFEELDYPYDVLWLDIEHTDGKRYFTWDEKAFPNPVEMQKKLGGHGRRMVTIIDPHIKRDNNYYIHKEATSLGLYIKDKNGDKDFDGWCWPGSSSYLDFTTEKVRDWWAEQFGYGKYKGSTPELFTWNDMVRSHDKRVQSLLGFFGILRLGDDGGVAPAGGNSFTADFVF